MQQSPDNQTPKPGCQDNEQIDGKVIRFTPRRRMEPESIPEPQGADDDDPGPSAA